MTYNVLFCVTLYIVTKYKMEKIKVKLLGVDNKTGKFKLSRKVLIPKESEAQ